MFFIRRITMVKEQEEVYKYVYYIEHAVLGHLTIICTDDALLEIHFNKVIFSDEVPGKHIEKLNEVSMRTVTQLEEYFLGKREQFDIPLAPTGTIFQKKVWNALCHIPYGETRTYKEIAISIGNPKACRAVGMANNRNPIPIIIPCHRVIGADGTLIGYGGGLEKKEWLLQVEKKIVS